MDLLADFFMMIVSQFGISAGACGLAIAMAKVLKNSKIHVLYKPVLIIFAALARVIIVSLGCLINRYMCTLTLSGNVFKFNDSKESFFYFLCNKTLVVLLSIYSYIRFRDLIIYIGFLTFVSLSLIFILFIIKYFKLYYDKYNIEFNLSSFIGDKANNHFNYYFTKIIKFICNIDTFYISS